MRRVIFVSVAIWFFLFGFDSQADVRGEVVLYDLICEYQKNPVGIDQLNPRLSWKIRSTQKNMIQKAYEIRVSTKYGQWAEPFLVWNSGKIISDQSIFVPYSGKPLNSKERYYWQVRIWDNSGTVSSWSEISFWEMGILDKEDWEAKWVYNDGDTLRDSGPSPMFRSRFEVRKNVLKARLYITSHGLYEANINNDRVGEDYFTPGFTSYYKNLQYQTYDVTDLVQKGTNVIAVTLGDGWFRGNIVLIGRAHYGKRLALLAQLEITYEDGTIERVVTNEDWKTSLNGPIRSSDIYNGETYDARMFDPKWTTALFDDRSWKNVSVDPSIGYEQLVSSPAPPVKIHEQLRPVEVILTPKGEKVIDFGQNLVGWVRFNVKAQAGDSLIIYHAEVLDKQGNFYTDNLRDAQQRVVYIFTGDEEEVYQPHFSFQGFRYIKLEGSKELINEDNIMAMVLHSGMTATGSFETSDQLLNQLQRNIVWSQKGNFLDIPTDCPQRDERLGWTGDAQVFFNTAAYNMNVAGFFIKWLRDLRFDQLDNGAVTDLVPNVWGQGASATTGWADAATIIPWQFYLLYGDSKVLIDQYESMKKWVAYMVSNSKEGLWNTGTHFGDWLFYRPHDDTDGRAAITNKHLIAQAFFVHSTQLLIQTADVLGKFEDADYYKTLLDKVKAAFVREYVTASGRLVSDSQTAYVLALQFDILPEELREQAAQRLVNNISEYGYHLTTGFLGTPYLCHVLSRYGYDDVAYKLLTRKKYPSWLYPVTQGATTIWERWDGQKPDGSFQNEEMNSFNHYAYGSIGDWMYKQIIGIQPLTQFPGYKKFVIAPKIGGGLTKAKGNLESPYGLISSEWTLEQGVVTLSVKVPENTQAEIQFPDLLKDSSVRMDGKAISNNRVSVGSGQYIFHYKIENSANSRQQN